MRKIHYFPSKAAYEEFVWREIFNDPLVSDVPFYRNLIQFVLDHKAPVFYLPSDTDVEHANFSNYFNFQLMRENYQDNLMRVMFFTHEFTHMMCPFPRGKHDLTLQNFTGQFIASEYTASNETEVLLHYRSPGIRKKVLADKLILADVLKARGCPKPAAAHLFKVRPLLVETTALDSLLATNPAEAELLASFKKYQGNEPWCRRFYDTIKDTEWVDYPYQSLSAETYESQLENYQTTATQASYEAVTLANFQNACRSVGIEPPGSFGDCADAAKRLKNAVFTVKSEAAA